MSFLHHATARYCRVDGLVFRLRSVSASDLAGVGHAYLEGMQAASIGADSAAEDLAEELRAVGESEEDVAAAVARLQADAAKVALRRHQQATSTPAGRKAYHERVRAYVCASVTGIGFAAEPLQRQQPGLPAWELCPVGVVPESREWTVASIVDTERPSAADEAAVLEAHHAAEEVPLWALSPEIVEAVALVAAQLAGGRAASVAPFRAFAADV